VRLDQIQVIDFNGDGVADVFPMLGESPVVDRFAGHLLVNADAKLNSAVSQLQRGRGMSTS
jgi:hypothetical protein